MKNIFKMTAFTLLFASFAICNVDAATYVNNKGVLIDSNVVEEFGDHISSNMFNNMSQDVYNMYEFKYNNGYQIVSEIQVQRNLVIDGEIVESENYVMSEEEYDEFSNIEPYATCSSGTGGNIGVCYQTDAKRIFYEFSKNSNQFAVSLWAVWLREPNVKGTDVIAIRHAGTVNVSTIAGEQWVSTSEQVIDYDSNSSNTQIFSNGVGISMNLKDASTSFSLALHLSGTYSGSVSLYGSYQHGKNFTTVAESKQYTINSSGYGGVIKFNTTTIANKYDNMPGISYSF